MSRGIAMTGSFKYVIACAALIHTSHIYPSRPMTSFMWQCGVQEICSDFLLLFRPCNLPGSPGCECGVQRSFCSIFSSACIVDHDTPSCVYHQRFYNHTLYTCMHVGFAPLGSREAGRVGVSGMRKCDYWMEVLRCSFPLSAVMFLRDHAVDLLCIVLLAPIRAT